MYLNYKKGFSLLELILVLGVGIAFAFMRFQEMLQQQDEIRASVSGKQIKQIGDATNGYISLRYDKISSLSNAAGNGTDPGPRNCSGNICTITYQTLVNEGLLPSTYVAKNGFGSGYNIQISRSGISPNYIIDGVVLTNAAWVEGGKVRYDLLGKAMQSAGIDSGVSKNTTTVNGYGGGWSSSSSTYSLINKTGLLAYRTGYNSFAYSAYLRRDGTLPMTGNLDMGANDINNAKNITASGNASFGGTGNFIGNLITMGSVLAAKELIAHNGYGDAIYFGGDTANNDYEIRLGAPKQLTIYSPSAGNYTTVLQVNRNVKIDQRLGLMGYDPNDIPIGWNGGLRTVDVYAEGAIGIKRANGSGNSDLAFSANNDGNVFSSGNITTNQRVIANDIQIKKIYSVGSPCTPNGLIGISSDGNSLSCINGLWQKISFNYSQYELTYTAPTEGTQDIIQTKVMGKHLVCFLTGDQHNPGLQKHSLVFRNGDEWILEQRMIKWPAQIITWAKATCID